MTIPHEQATAVAGNRRRPPRTAELVLPTVNLFGICVTNASKRQAVALMDSWIAARDRRARAVFIVNAHTLNLAWTSPAYNEVLNAGDVVFADGSGVRVAARLKGVRLRDNLVGTDLLPLFFRAKRQRGYGYFLLGGQRQTAERAAARLHADVPGIRIVGHHHGCFDADDSPRVVDAINATAPDMLLVGMGNPTQEHWIHRNLSGLNVPVSVGVGGLFDHWAGHLRRAPPWVRSLGMEWSQLLLQQPHKWRRYLVGNPVFVYRALRDLRSGR